MSPWKCPHCGTPQAESARCWACSRSPATCSTCRDFRRSVAGHLGYCAADRVHRVLSGDEIRDCWQAPATTPGPFQGLFGSLQPAGPPPLPVGAEAPPARAPTAAVAAQRRWDEIVSARTKAPATTRAAPIPVGPDLPDALDATSRSRPDRRTTTWTPLAPTAATPSVLPAAQTDATRWRHPADDERRPRTPETATEPDAPRRAAALSLLPATLANRLRRHVADRGPRVAQGEGDATRSSTPAPPAPGGRVAFATARPTGAGRLVEAPSVPPSATILSLGDQLRRAEQIRRERALLDVEPLRGKGGGDTGP